MKYVVLCSCELHNAAGKLADREQVLRELANAGFKPVGCERTGGVASGKPIAALGEFRSHSYELLRERLQRDLEARVRGLGLEVSVSLYIKPAESLEEPRQSGSY